MPKREKPFRKAQLLKKLAIMMFARLSFENERDKGLYPEVFIYEDLDEDTAAGFTENARLYVEHQPVHDWPTYVLERLGG